MRLDFFLANSANVSRKEARRIIMAGRVTLEGEVCKKAATPATAQSQVCLDGQSLTLQGERYLMLHKPVDYVSATTDSEHPTVLDLLPPDLRRNLHIAGRLDLDTTGLLLLTTDGQWSHRVTSPRSHCAKTYRMTLAEPLTQDMLRQLAEGVQLKGEEKTTAPAEVEALGERSLRLTITEGRYHQVKRMLAAVGNHVLSLHRERIGTISLDPALAPGAYRALTEDEVAGFR